MSTVDDRRLASVCGVLVADAAAMPLHWVYDQTVLDDLIGQVEAPEFRQDSANPFYILKTGLNSCYADQAYLVLKSLVKNKGLNMQELHKETIAYFGSGTEYDNPNRTTGQRPVEGRWLHKSLIESMENFQAGKEETGSMDKANDMGCRLVPVVAMYAGKPDMLQKVQDVVMATQKNPETVACALAAARLLEKYILHGSSPTAVEEVIQVLQSADRPHPTELDNQIAQYFQQALDARSSNHTEVTAKFGKNCYVPGNLQSCIHALVTNDNYQSAVRCTIRAGGCNASRSAYIGACMAAQFGLSGIPESWKQQTHRFKEALKLGQQLVKLSSNI